MENVKEGVIEKGRQVTNAVIDGIMETLQNNDENFDNTRKDMDCVILLSNFENGEETEDSYHVQSRNAILGRRAAIEEVLSAAYNDKESPVRAAMRKVVMDDLFGGE